MDGIYRVSGNLAVIQKLRHKADHGDPDGPGGTGGLSLGLPFSYLCLHVIPAEEHLDLDDGQWEEIHVITGALKLFLRELPEPLFPFSCFEKFIAAIREYLLELEP